MVHFNDSIFYCWVWSGAKEGTYSTASAYKWLLDRHLGWDSDQNWDWVWHIGVPAFNILSGYVYIMLSPLMK